MKLPELQMHLQNITDVCLKKGIPTNNVEVTFVDHISSMGGESPVRVEVPLSNVQLINGKVYIYHPTSFYQLQTMIELEKKLKESKGE